VRVPSLYAVLTSKNTRGTVYYMVTEYIDGFTLWELVIHMHTEETGDCILIMYRVKLRTVGIHGWL
jgi:hypothetical protein